VKSAVVERQLPDTIVVKLIERRPFAIWQNNGKFMLIDHNGNVVAHQNVMDFRKLPLVVGPGAPQAAAGLLDTLGSLPALQARVAAAVRVGDRRWDLQMNNRTEVMLPEGHEAAALDRLMQLQQSHDLLDRPLVAIDMRLPDRMVLRPRVAPPTAADATKKPT
jgi:cell division protein FtsQ